MLFLTANCQTFRLIGTYSAVIISSVCGISPSNCTSVYALQKYVVNIFNIASEVLGKVLLMALWCLNCSVQHVAEECSDVL